MFSALGHDTREANAYRFSSLGHDRRPRCPHHRFSPKCVRPKGCYSYEDALHLDERKAESNLRKHGVSFDEAVTAFVDPLALYVEDVEHDGRMVLVGESIASRVLLTVFAELDDDVIRIISARRVTSHERRRYEEGNA